MGGRGWRRRGSRQRQDGVLIPTVRGDADPNVWRAVEIPGAAASVREAGRLPDPIDTLQRAPPQFVRQWTIASLSCRTLPHRRGGRVISIEQFLAGADEMPVIGPAHGMN